MQLVPWSILGVGLFGVFLTTISLVGLGHEYLVRRNRRKALAVRFAEVQAAVYEAAKKS